MLKGEFDLPRLLGTDVRNGPLLQKAFHFVLGPGHRPRLALGQFLGVGGASVGGVRCESFGKEFLVGTSSGEVSTVGINNAQEHLPFVRSWIVGGEKHLRAKPEALALPNRLLALIAVAPRIGACVSVHGEQRVAIRRSKYEGTEMAACIGVQPAFVNEGFDIRERLGGICNLDVALRHAP